MANADLIAAYKRNAENIILAPAIKPYAPTPTEKDYDLGEIRRYFAQQTNQKNGEIFEISEQNYSKLNNSPAYLTISLRWKIAGPSTSVRRIIDGESVRERSGVVEANTVAVEQAAKVMPAITQKLSNPFQLWRGF